MIDHLERDRTRERANISVYAELFFFLVFLSFRADHHEEKNETLTQREPQISQTGEEKRSKRH